MQTPEQRIAEMGLELPEAHGTMANYVNSVLTGNLLFVAGHGPFLGGQPALTGRVGDDVPLDRAREAARLTTLNVLRTVKGAVGDLSKVSRVVRLFVMVNSHPGFTQQHLVADGATDLLVEIFGEKGRPARAAVGMVSLPFNIPVEVESVFEISS